MNSNKIFTVNSEINISDIIYLTKNDARFGIITAIRLYGALNLKKMANILGKSETTLIHHLHELLDKEFIKQLDRKKLGKKGERGKFYGLTEKSKKINHLLTQEYWGQDHVVKIEDLKRKTAEEFKQAYIQQLRSISSVFPILNLKAMATLNKSIMDITAQELEKIINVLKVNKDPEISLGSTTLYVNSIPVGNHSHVLRIVELTVEYLRKLTEIEQEIRADLKTMKSKNAETLTQFQYVYLGTAPISSDLHSKEVKSI